MSEKAPAFQWYPKDYLSDENVVLMTLEEEGAYRRLMDFCWLHGSLPDDMKALGAMCKNVDSSAMAVLWSAISRCFVEQDGRWVHPRLEKERRKQEARRESKKQAGKKGAEARWGKGKNGTAIALPSTKEPDSSAIDVPLAKNGSSSPSPSTSATPVGVCTHTRDTPDGISSLTEKKVKGLYGYAGNEGMDPLLAKAIDDPAERDRCVDIALARFDAEEKPYHGKFFRKILLDVIAEQSAPARTGTDNLDHWRD